MNQERKIAIYNKTNGCCHICHKKLALKNHGKNNEKGAWHIEHSRARANGGTDHLNNLFAACIPCNLEKGVLHTRTARKRNGTTRAPHCKAKKEQIRNDNAVKGGAIGLLTTALFGLNPAVIIGVTFLGVIIGNDIPVKR